ncbi:hypothetical protein GGI22_004263, partial [Coemansia erecta]
MTKVDTATTPVRTPGKGSQSARGRGASTGAVRRLGRPPKHLSEATPTKSRTPKSARKAKDHKGTLNGGTVGDKETDDDQPPVKRRRTYTKRKHALKALDLNARVFFSNRLNAHEASTERFIPTDDDRLAFEAVRADVSTAEARATGISQSQLDPSTPSTPGAVVSG